MVRNKPAILKSSDLYNNRDHRALLDKIKKLEEHNLGHEMEIKELLSKIWDL